MVWSRQSSWVRRKDSILQVVVEGVETFAQLECLSQIHCDQGYLLSHQLDSE